MGETTTLRPVLCIVDFEATCWGDGNRGKREEMEIIEIGAVLAESSGLRKLAEFQSFIKPVRNPVLSDFCRALTSIEQRDVDRAPEFPAVMAKFSAWLGDGRDSRDVEFSSWGQYDFNQLRQDCDYHRQPWPFFTDSHINLKKRVAEKLGWSEKGVHKAMDRLGMKFEGTAHRGIDDARNILRIVQKVGL